MLNSASRKRVVYDDLADETLGNLNASTSGTTASRTSHRQSNPPSWSSPGGSTLLDRSPGGMLPGGKSFNIFGESDAKALQADAALNHDDLEALKEAARQQVGKKRKRPVDATPANKQINQAMNGNSQKRGGDPSTSNGSARQANHQASSAALQPTTPASTRASKVRSSPSGPSPSTAQALKLAARLPSSSTSNGAESKTVVLSAAAAALLPPGTEVGALVVEETSGMEDDEDLDEMDLFQVETTENLRQHGQKPKAEGSASSPSTTAAGPSREDKSLRSKEWETYGGNEWDDDFDAVPQEQMEAQHKPQKEPSPQTRKKGKERLDDTRPAATEKIPAAPARVQADESYEEGELDGQDYEEGARGEEDEYMEDGEYNEGDYEEEQEEEGIDPSAVNWGELSTGAAAGGNRGRSSRENKAGGRALTHAEIWDDSALVDAWEAAQQEYEIYHSRRAAAAATGTGTAEGSNRRDQTSGLWNESADANSDTARTAQKQAVEANRAALAARKAASLASKEKAKEKRPTIADALPTSLIDAPSYAKAAAIVSDTPNFQHWTPIGEPGGPSSASAASNPGAAARSAASNAASARTLPGVAGGNDDMLQNVIMAWYWAGYYTAVYSGAAAGTPQPGPGPPGPL